MRAKTKPILFTLDGREVHCGDLLHVAPDYQSKAGATVEAYREALDGFAVFRSVTNGAVPTMPLSAVSWEPNPDTIDLETMRKQGIRRPSVKDLEIWRLGRYHAQSIQQQDSNLLPFSKTKDGKLVKAGDKVWVCGSVGVHETTVLSPSPVTDYNFFGPIPVSESFSSKEAAKSSRV